jgi:hypothetical protein
MHTSLLVRSFGRSFSVSPPQPSVPSNAELKRKSHTTMTTVASALAYDWVCNLLKIHCFECQSNSPPPAVVELQGLDSIRLDHLASIHCSTNGLHNLSKWWRHSELLFQHDE